MKKGFTLIELAMVMVVIGLVIGGGIQMMSVMSKRAKITEVKQQLESAREAIIGFVQVNGNLPTQAEFQNLWTGSKDQITGVALDPWNKPILYISSLHFANTTDICNYRVADLNVSNYVSAVDVAFVIVSSSENYNMQTRLRTASTPDEVRIYSPSQQIDDNTTDFNRATDKYDDLYRFVTLQELKSAINCQDSALEIIPMTLPSTYEKQIYNANINANGGIPFADAGDTDGDPDYRWCWEGNTPNIGIAAICNGNLAISSSPQLCTDINGNFNPAATWRSCTTLTFAGTITDNNTSQISNLILYVQDNDNNLHLRRFSITKNTD